MPLNIIVVMLFSLLIGYAAQVTGLCLVRGVSDWRNGHRLRLLAILSSGFWLYFYLLFADRAQVAIGLEGYGFHWAFLLGGGIFGLGAALNGACSISTAARLSSGDIVMLFTIAGWFLGWALMDFSGALPGYRAQSIDIVWPAWVAPPGLLAASITVYWRYRTLWPVWVGISLVGIMAGAIFLHQPAWSPSDFVRDVGLALAHRNAAILPGIDRVGILLFVLTGMFLGAWRYRRFHWAIPGLRPISKHLAGGVMMGLGSSLALGGNDFQLLLALPAVSPAGLSATIGMLVGIRMGLSLTRDRLLNRTFS